MKNHFFLLLLLIGIMAMAMAMAIATNLPQTPTPHAKTPEEESYLTDISFDKLLHDFGDVVQQDEKLTCTFEFTNTGKNPLVISSAKSSCGCMYAVPPREPIYPGEKGKIEVYFSIKGKSNRQTKTITVNANTKPSNTRLTIKANIVLAQEGG